MRCAVSHASTSTVAYDSMHAERRTGRIRAGERDQHGITTKAHTWKARLKMGLSSRAERLSRKCTDPPTLGRTRLQGKG
jgi:hypothetical protein